MFSHTVIQTQMMSEIRLKVFFVLVGLTFVLANGVGIHTGEPHRKVLCREGRFDFKNVQCAHRDSEQTLIALHNVLFGYLNESVNCTETEDTMGCEEQMSDRQMKIILQKGSAQPSITALQFPAVDASTKCKGYGDEPVYMAFIYDCLQMSSITEMCTTTTKTGQRISVYNKGYPAISPVQDTHHCECVVTSPSPVILISIYDYQLNCTGNNQNLTIEDENGVVLHPVCDSFQKGQRNSSNQNLTMVWKGQISRIGLFWIGFQAADTLTNVTVDCYPIWDPTTTTTSTTTTTTTSTTAASTLTSSTIYTAAAFSSLFPNTSQTVPRYPTNNAPSNHSRTVSTETINIVDNQKKEPMPKKVIYALAGAGGGLLLIIIIICVVVVKRRNNVEEADRLQMRNMSTNRTSISKDQKQVEHSRASRVSQGKGAENRKHSAALELQLKDNDKMGRVSSKSTEKTDEKKIRVSKAADEDSNPRVITERRRETASSKADNTARKNISKK